MTKSSGKVHSAAFGLLSAALLLQCACDTNRMEVTGPTQTTTLSLDKGSVDHVNLQLDLKAGQLNVSGGAKKLVDGKFEFNVDSYKPNVRNRSDGRHATITIEQPRVIEVGTSGKNTWDLQLNDDSVLDLIVNCGAGQAKMDLGSLSLRSLQVHMGAGQLDLDLSGHPKRDYDVEIAGGIGQATIRLPQEVGIRADVHGGLGEIKVSGLEKKGDHYENESYDTALVNVRLKVSGGIGEIHIME